METNPPFSSLCVELLLFLDRSDIDGENQVSFTPGGRKRFSSP